MAVRLAVVAACSLAAAQGSAQVGKPAPRPERVETPVDQGREVSKLPGATTPTDARQLPGEATRTGRSRPIAATPLNQDATPVTQNAGGPPMELAAIATETLGAPGVAAAEKACLGLQMGGVEFAGCPGTRCGEGSVQKRMVSLTDLHTGKPLVAGQLALALDRVQRLGFFRTVDISCLPDIRGQAHVTFRVVGNAFVRRVQFAGNKTLFTDELRGKSLIHPGDVLNPDTSEGKNLLNRECWSIESLYQRAGYDHARATAATRVSGRGELEVTLTIEEGERQHVTELRVAIAEPPAPTVEEVAAGLVCAKVTEKNLRDASELLGAEVFTERSANKAKIRVRNYLRRRGYPSSQVDVKRDPSGAVTIGAALGRCNLVRILTRDDSGSSASGSSAMSSDSANGSAATTGFSLSEEAAFYDALPFAESGLFDFDEADRGREDLQAVLENRGYLFADVRLDFRPVPAILGTQVETAITYYVTTGYVSQVRGISFPGRHAFDENTLKAQMSTRAYDFFDTGGYAQVDQLLADLDSLKQFYRNEGFYQFQFDLALPEADTTTTLPLGRGRIETRAATIYQYRYRGKGFQIRKPRDENFIYVDVPVTEGQQTRLGRLRIDGARQVEESEVRQLFRLTEQHVISYEKLVAAGSGVVARYRNAGFFRMTLKMLCTTRDPAAAEEVCSAENMLAGTVELRLVIDEGEQVDVGEVFVTGNFQTSEDVILRDMPERGVPFAEDVLFDSQRKLRNLGIFTQVALQYVGREETPPRKRVAIVVQVVEGQNEYMEGAVGFQTVNTLRATAARDSKGNVASAGEVESVPALVDAVGHLVSGADRLTLGFGQNIGLSVPNLLAILELTYVNRNFARLGKDFRIPLKIGGNFSPAYVQCRTPFGAKDTIGAVAEQGYCPGDGFGDRFASRVRFLSLLPSYYDSRLLGSEWGLRLIVPYFVHDWAIQAIDLDKFGMIVEVSRRFGKLASSLGIDVGGIRSKRPDEPDFTTTGGLQPQLQVIPRLTYDNTDSPLNPTRGFFLTAAIPLIDTIIKVPNPPDCPSLTSSCRAQTYSFPQVQFVKWEATGKSFFTFGSTLTLAAMVHAGFGTSIEKDRPPALPQPERFRLGGQYGVRGFADYGLRQYDSQGCTRAKRNVVDPVSHVTRVETVSVGQECGSPLAGDLLTSDGNVVANGSVELRFPLLRDSGFWGSAFWDFGAVAESWSGENGLHAESVRHGVGLGLRWLLSGQIPVRVDYGFAVGRRCRDLPAGSDQCVQDEFGRLHLALLYSF